MVLRSEKAAQNDRKITPIHLEHVSEDVSIFKNHYVKQTPLRYKTLSFLKPDINLLDEAVAPLTPA